jgi:RNA polymerase sigma factor (sigma-70 family)
VKVIGTDSRWDLEFTEWCQTVEHRLLRFAYYLCDDRHEAEDLVQITFEKLWKAWPEKSESIRRAYSYAATTLQNAFNDECRRRRLKLAELREEHDQPILDVTQFTSTDLEINLDTAIRNLPDRQRELIYLVHYEGMSLADAADTMGIAAKTAHNYHDLAKRNLKQMLEALVEAGEGRHGQYSP